MKRILLAALSLSYLASASAIEYGSKVIATEENPKISVEAFAKELCQKSRYEAKLPARQNGRGGYTHITCHRDGKKTADIFAKESAGRMHINYRLQ